MGICHTRATKDGSGCLVLQMVGSRSQWQTDPSSSDYREREKIRPQIFGSETDLWPEIGDQRKGSTAEKGRPDRRPTSDTLPMTTTSAAPISRNGHSPSSHTSNHHLPHPPP